MVNLSGRERVGSSQRHGPRRTRRIIQLQPAVVVRANKAVLVPVDDPPRFDDGEHLIVIEPEFVLCVGKLPLGGNAEPPRNPRCGVGHASSTPAALVSDAVFDFFFDDGCAPRHPLSTIEGATFQLAVEARENRVLTDRRVLRSQPSPC